MRRAAWGCASIALAAFVAPSCRAPTEITLLVTTDVKCAELQGTTITVGRLGEIETKAPTTSSTFCTASGDLGALVVVPSGGKSAEVAVKIVGGVGRDAASCAPPYGKGCIVARRAIRYLPHTPLRVGVPLRAACAGVPCSQEQTCVSGKCVGAEIDASACKGAAGCGEDALGPGADAGAGAEAGPAPTSYTRVFFDGFEDGTTNAWTNGDHTPCTAVAVGRDGTPPHAGRSMAECNWNGQLPWNDPSAYTTLGLDTWPYTRETFVRFWWRLDADVDKLDVDVHQCNGPGLALVGWVNAPTQSIAAWSALYSTTGGGYLSQVTYVNEQDSPVVDFCGGWVNPYDAAWHEAELHVRHDVGGQGGEIMAWFDHQADTSCGYPYVGRTFNGTSGWNTLSLTSEWPANCSLAPDAANHIYFDDVEIFSDDPRGTGAVGSMEDASIR